MTFHVVICRAIWSRTLLEFDYDELHRIVAPYCHGVSQKNVEVLRAVQVGGSSRSAALGFGKLWIAEKMQGLRNSNERFVPTDPNYNPDDTAMIRIHCRI